MKYEIKIKQRHPSNSFQLGSHSISNVPKVYDLSPEEVKELMGAGCQHWLAHKEVEEVKKPKRAKKED